MVSGTLRASGIRHSQRSSASMSSRRLFLGRLLSSVGPWAMGTTRKELRGIMWRRGLEYRPSLQWCSQSSPFFQCGPELRDQNSGDASPLKGEPAIPIGRVLTLTARTLVPAKSTRSQRCREKN